MTIAAIIQIKGKNACKWNGTLKIVRKNKSDNCICVLDIERRRSSINSNKLITTTIKDTIIPTQKRYLREMYKLIVEKIDNLKIINMDAAFYHVHQK